MVIAELRPHARVVCNLKSPISQWCRHVSCSQFGIHQIAIETLVLYVPVINEKAIELINDYFHDLS